MSRSEAKKVLKYIKKGSVSKLRNFVLRNDVNLNKIRDSQQRGVLHLACYLGEGRITKCLLRCGADPCTIDDCGNTALHIALEYALEFNSESVFTDLIIPLKKKSKRVMQLKNRQGVTPDELLAKLKEAMKRDLLVEEENVKWEEVREREVREKEEREREGREKEDQKEEEREWMEKLAFEHSCEDFYFKEDPSPSPEETTETYSEWVDRIKREYHTKRTQANNSTSKETKREEKNTEETEWDKVTKKLEKDHEEYIKSIQQKRKVLSLGKEKENYEQKCADVLEKASTQQLTFWDVPWPCSGSAADIVEKLVAWADENEKMKYLKLQRIRWHPDKFLQRCKHRMKGKDGERIMDLVKQISQGINALITSL